MSGPSHPTDDELRALLLRAGLRPTRQRRQLARALFTGEHRHVTAEALHREVLRDGTPVALATVYNTLHQFTGAGLLREIAVDAGRVWFDTNATAHHHFFNVRSRELTDIPAGEVVIGELPAPPAGTSVDGVDVVVRVAPRKARGPASRENSDPAS